MHEEMLPYYERELSALRHLAGEFAQEFPKVAGRLLMEGDIIEDPHAERLMEAFAFLAARIHLKLDDEFPEISDALIGILYPHYLRPIPSMSIAEFQIDPDELHLTGRHVVARHRDLYSRPVNEMPCRFRTCYPVELWPVRVAKASFVPLERSEFSRRGNAAVAALEITLEALGGTRFGTLGLDRLRFFLDGEAPLMHALYELLFTRAHSIRVAADEEEGVLIPAGSLRQVGFEDDEGMLEYDARSLLAYRLLHEYFAFPEKFMFVDFTGLDRAIAESAGTTLRITVYFNDFERRERIYALADAVDAATFRLGCTPIVNLFRQNAEPLVVTHQKTEYQVLPDVRRAWGMEVYAIESVRKVVRAADRARIVEYRPFYSLKHVGTEGEEETFWHATRRPSPRQDDPGTDMYLALVDRQFSPTLPATDTLTIEVTCLNRDLPGLLPFGGDQGNLETEGEAPVSRIRCLRKPTATVRPARRKGAIWRLVSHLSLNHLSIVEDGREALLEILSLYNFSESPALDKQIGGILRVDSEPIVAKIGPPERQGFVRGTGIRLEFDEEEYVGAGVYLFASVLERFFALYASVNSFTQLTAITQQRERPLAKWPPRAGNQILL